MIKATLVRGCSSDEGTPGLWSMPGFTCRTLELPWRDNAKRVSCIPEGVYTCRIVNSPKFGRIYEVCNVPGRGNILIHSGNVAGDVSLGKKSHVQGCILQGKYLGRIDGQRAVLLSKPTIKAFMAKLAGAPFTLEIKSC